MAGGSTATGAVVNFRDGFKCGGEEKNLIGKKGGEKSFDANFQHAWRSACEDRAPVLIREYVGVAQTNPGCHAIF
jgi:hypothetical protein